MLGDSAWLRAHLSGPDPADPDIATRDASATAWSDDLPLHAGLVPAAVLVAIVTGPRPGVLLTRRTETLRSHAGQVSFPGGRIDVEDESPEAAALREAEEEIGLDPARVDVIGRLRDYATGTNYRVTPVLALLEPGYAVTASPAEVADIFELPLETLLDPNAPSRQSVEWEGRIRHYWVWAHPDHYIWGATAAILVHLARRLGAEEPAAAGSEFGAQST